MPEFHTASPLLLPACYTPQHGARMCSPAMPANGLPPDNLYRHRQLRLQPGAEHLPEQVCRHMCVLFRWWGGGRPSPFSALPGHSLQSSRLAPPSGSWHDLHRRAALLPLCSMGKGVDMRPIDLLKAYVFEAVPVSEQVPAPGPPLALASCVCVCCCLPNPLLPPVVEQFVPLPC